MFITDADLKQAVADTLSKSLTDLPEKWDRIVTRANKDAYNDIISILLGRGYSQSQIDAWDRGESIQTLQGLYWAFVHGAGLHNYDDRWVNKFDQRAYLKDPALLIDDGGVPSSAGEGVAMSGLLDTEDDRFKIDDRW